MATLGSMLVKIGADIKDFTQGMKSVEQSMSKLQKSAKQTAEGVTKPFESFKEVAVGAVTAVNASIAGLAMTKGIQINADMETALMSFETLLGTASDAKKMVADLQKFGAQTPFEFAGLQDSAKLMLAMGFQAKDIMPNLQSIGNAVSAIGGNGETLNGVTMALGQMLTKGKVSAEEMNQLAERGIPAWDLLSQAMGKPKAELMKLAEQGKLLSDKAVPAMLDQMNKKYAGAMDKQSKTFSGMLSTLKDTANMVLGNLTQPLFENLKTMLPIAIDFSNKLMSAFQKGGMKGALEAIFPKPIALTIIGIGKAIGTLFNFLVNNWSIIAPILTRIFEGFLAFKTITTVVTAFKAVKNAISLVKDSIVYISNPIGIAVLAIGALATIAYLVIDNWDSIKQFFIDLWTGVKSAFKTAIDFLINLFLNFTPLGLIIKNWETITNFFTVVWMAIKLIFLTTLQLIIGFLKSWGILDFFMNVWNGIVVIWNAIASVLTTVWNWITGIAMTVFNALYSFFATIFMAYWTVVSTIWNAIYGIFSSIFGAIYGVVSSIATTIWKFLVDKFTLAKNTISNIFQGIKDSISDKLEGAKKIVKSIIDKIVSFFTGADIHFPHIPVPHFNVTGKFSLNPPSVPNLDIGWYAHGGVFNGASVIGVGERGKEAVVPLTSSRMLPFASAIADNLANRGGSASGGQASGGTVTVEVPVYLDGKVIARVTAPHMNTELNQINKQNQRARGVF